MSSKNNQNGMVPGVIYTISIPRKHPSHHPHRKKSYISHVIFAVALLVALTATMLSVLAGVNAEETVSVPAQPEVKTAVIKAQDVEPTVVEPAKVEMLEVVPPEPKITEPEVTEELEAVTPIENTEPEVIESIEPKEPEVMTERNTYALKYWAEHDNGRPAGYDTSLGEFKISFYCVCKECCGKDPDHPAYGITASGKKVSEGTTIAVYRKQIPFGTKVYIEGLGTFEAQDTGALIKENCIDVFIGSHQEGNQCGIEYLNVYTE